MPHTALVIVPIRYVIPTVAAMMARFRRDQLVEHVPQPAAGHLPESLVERQVEQLVEDEPPRQRGIGGSRDHPAAARIGTSFRTAAVSGSEYTPKASASMPRMPPLPSMA